MAWCLHADPSHRPSTDAFLAELDSIRIASVVLLDGGYSIVVGSDAAVAAPSAAAAYDAAPAASASASRAVDVVDMSEALAAMEALLVASDVSDRVCEGMVLAGAETGKVTGTQFLQMVVDEGVKPATAMKLRQRLRITCMVPLPRVRLHRLCGEQGTCVTFYVLYCTALHCTTVLYYTVLMCCGSALG